MKSNQYDIISCKLCRYYSCKKVDNYSSVHKCRKDYKVEPDKLELRCNRDCFAKKLFSLKSKIKVKS